MEDNNKIRDQEGVAGNEAAEAMPNQKEQENAKNVQDYNASARDAEAGQGSAGDTVTGDKAESRGGQENQFVGKILGEIKGTLSDKNSVNIYIGYRNEINNGIQVGDDATINDINFKVDDAASGEEKAEESIAKDNKRLRGWINENYFSSSLALLIIIAVFNEMPYNWILNEKGNLDTYLPKGDEYQLDTKAVEERLEEIGAEICMGEVSDYTGKREERFIRFSDEKDADIILEYLWLQYPDLRMPLQRWFVGHIRKGRNIYVKRITRALSKLACVDYGYFANEMISGFYQEKNISVDMTLSQILIFLLDGQREKVMSMLAHWSTQERVHPLLTVLLVAGELQEERILRAGIKTYLARVYYDFEKENDEFFDHIVDFFAVGIRKAFFYRIMIEEIYELFFTEDTLSQHKDRKITLFFIISLIDVKLLVEGKGGREEAILVKMCIAPNSAKDKLCAIWRMVWHAHSYRWEFYQVLGEYYRWLDDERLRKNIVLFIDVILGRSVSLEAKSDAYKKIQRNAKRKE